MTMHYVNYDAIAGRSVMVTGAGGSIGAELVWQIAASRPKNLILVDSSEFNLYEVNARLEAAITVSGHVRLPAIADVRDLDTMRHLFVTEKPDIVFHAAALKHVPLLENDHNLVEAVRTNVMGTKNIADLCASNGVDMVMVSTDKAMYPSSVMGLTKRVAEIYVHAIALRYPNSRIAQVRFGNVMGSSGSVLPKFQKQIAAGGPVTVTHPEMTRYMMTITQAVALVLSAATLHQTSDDRFGLYILDMGKPVNIYDLAISLIEQAGFRPYTDIPIEMIGIRPGEKLHEQLTYEWEVLKHTEIGGVSRAVPKVNPERAKGGMEQLIWEAGRRRVEGVKTALTSIVPEYSGVGVWA